MIDRVGIVVVHAADEVGRNDAGALVQCLEEAVLHIGARPAPPHRHGIGGDRLAITLHTLAQAFHHQLLQVGRQQRQALVVGHHRMRGMAQQVAVPDVGQAVQHRQVALQRCIQRMRIHLRSTFQQLFKALEADRQRDRETDRRPQRIAAADPIPHRQHTIGGDGKGLGGTFRIGADRVQAIAATQPVVQDLAVEQGFLGAEGLGDQDAGGLGRIQRGQRTLHGRAVHVRYEMHAQARTADRTQRVGDQARAKVGTTDADTDYIGYATVFQRAHQHAHALADLARGGIGLGRHRRIDHVAAQCGVQRGATFGQVDLLATEQAGDGTTDITVGSQRQQCLQRRGIVFLPGEADVQRTDP